MNTDCSWGTKQFFTWRHLSPSLWASSNGSWKKGLLACSEKFVCTELYCSWSLMWHHMCLYMRGRRQPSHASVYAQGRLRILFVPEYSIMEKNLYVWGIAIFAAFGGFMFGYDTGWVAAASSCLLHINWSVSRRVLSRCSYVAWG